MPMERGNRSQGKLSADPPRVTEDNFSFPKRFWYNKERQIFEIVDNAEKNLLEQLKGLVQAYTSSDPFYNVTIKAAKQSPTSKQNSTAQEQKFDDKFTVECLDREQGVSWIRSERLPAFLKSDCYFEYRLAKLLSQLDCNTGPGIPQLDQSHIPWHFETEGIPAPIIENKDDDAMKKLYICLGEASVTQTRALFTEANGKAAVKMVESDQRPTITMKTPLHLTSDIPNLAEHDLSDILLLTDMMDRVEAGKLPIRSQNDRYYSDLESDLDKCIRAFYRPKVVDNEIFEFVPEDPLETPGNVFLEVKSENMSECKVEKEERLRSDDKTMTHEDKIRTDINTIVQSSGSTQPSVPDVNRPFAKGTMETKAGIGVEPNISKPSQVNKESLLTVNNNIKDHVHTNAENLNVESTESDSSSEADIRDCCYPTASHRYNFKNRKGIEKFKNFIQGTAGEKYWWLWMDVERLKIIEDDWKRHRYLNVMQNRYLFSSGEYCINAEARERLGLSYSSQWTVEKLCQTQKDIVEPLLLYWGPRYCLNQGFPIRQTGIVLKHWEDRHLRPKSLVGPFLKTADKPLLGAKDSNWQEEYQGEKTHSKVPVHMTQIKVLPSKELLKEHGPEDNLQSMDQLLISDISVRSQFSRSNEAFENLQLWRTKKIHNLDKLMRITKYQAAVCSYKMDDLLQALQRERRTGYIFTIFCEQIGNLLWSNAVNLWYDLNEYQQLFRAEIFQPFKLRRQAQYIFATYIVDGSPSDVELDSENKKHIYKILEPPFEDLFDQIEEYTLILLLVPWMHMIEMDKSRFKKVELVRETRRLNSAYYKNLQELQKKIWPNQEIVLPVHSPSQVQLPADPNVENFWQKVPEKFHHYTLDTLIRDPRESKNFQEFLRQNFSGLDLKCWLDIEHFRRIPHSEKTIRNIKSKEIKSKYLNRTYFFGPSSPATKAQQNEVMMLAGGWGKLLHEQLSSNVLVEVQRYIKARMERKWLPMFLATPEFAERHRIQVQIQDVVEDQILQQSRKKHGVLKLADNKLVPTSMEIIAFRKALLNPITALQFRQFVSLKGEFMENNVNFWLEVQKYKEMCHSNTSDENIQNKVTSIINCFINSNIPPPLQIDIPQEHASKIINNREKQGIYIFREAQMAIFDVLLKLWPDFINFQHLVAVENTQLNTERKIRMEQEM
ncbi:regulator of G-protein signaling 22-like isoform X2 [Narcine bancroftii]|uniref:regulator of G-protein signaling 22-like isoform X2 n=1 Tax=Narcine bancroftii TaxID=1343680 RepID=UPI0038310CBE